MASFWRRDTGPTQRAVPEVDPDAILAAAARLNTTTKIPRRLAVPTEEWQAELWSFFDTCGEFEYAQNWLAQVSSGAELVVEQTVTGNEPVEVPTGLPRQLLDELLASCGGQEQFLYTSTIHVGTVGETYLVGFDQVDEAVGTVSGYRWLIVDASEILTTNEGTAIRDPDGGDDIKLGDNSVVLRFWRRHPREARRAHSPAKAVLPVLRTLQGLDKHVGASIDSRLAGNGLLVVPSEMTLTTVDGQVLNPSSTDFMRVLVEALITPIADRDSAAAVVPMLLQASGAHISEIKHITFTTPFDAEVGPLTEKSIKRMALGLNMPPEQLLGVGDANHWGAWQIEESGVKTNVRPVIGIVTDGLTERFLRPMLKLMGVTDWATYRIAAKLDGLVLRPNRAQQAGDLHDRLLISDETYRSVTGFDEGDKPEEDQLLLMVVRKLLIEGKLGIDGSTSLGPVTLIPIDSGAAELPAAADTTATPTTEGAPAPAGVGA